MNLLEWKQYQTQTFREELKKQMMNGVSHETHFLFSEEQLEEIRQEIEIEQYEETVSFDGEIEIDRPLLEKHSEVQEVLDFAPDENGSVMDLVFEFDLKHIDPSINGMNALRELLFAEEYEFITEEDMCPETCCGMPVSECTCGPDCEHCECYEINKNEKELGEEKNPAGGAKAKGKPSRAKVIFKRAKGEIKKKKICGPGMRLAGNRCLPQTGTQKAKMRRLGIKLKRARRAMGGGAKKKAALKSKITKRRVKGRSRSLANTTN